MYEDLGSHNSVKSFNIAFLLLWYVQCNYCRLLLDTYLIKVSVCNIVSYIDWSGQSRNHTQTETRKVL